MKTSSRRCLLVLASACCLVALETVTAFAFQLPPASTATASASPVIRTIISTTTAIRSSRRRTCRRRHPHSTCIHVKKQAKTDIVAVEEEPLAVIQSNDEQQAQEARTPPPKVLLIGDTDDKLLGLAVLLTVPIVWGSYVPVVKVLYQIDPPIPGFVFSTAYFAVASASSFGLLAALQQQQQQPPDNSSSCISISQQSAHEEEEPTKVETNNNCNENSNAWTTMMMMMTTTPPAPAVLAGAELGFYLFLGNSLQVIGLKTVPSDRAGFLVQMTTILVPLVQASLTKGSVITATTWISCIIALLGISIMGFDDDVGISSITAVDFSTTQQLSSFSLTSGDVLILSAAVVYSLHVVRLGRWANSTSPLKLVAYKATTELILGIVLLIVLAGIATTTTTTTDVMVDGSGLWVFLQESGHEIVNFFTVVSERLAAGTLPWSSMQLALAATLWTGLVSTAYPTYAQSFGQRRVSPTNANLIYSLQPIATAAFAYILLGETMGPFGILGGTLIGGAVYVAASQSFSASATTTLYDDERDEESDSSSLS